jgi:photosystem II stability/assembly factor-like uncharacterized protein
MTRTVAASVFAFALLFAPLGANVTAASTAARPAAPGAIAAAGIAVDSTVPSSFRALSVTFVSPSEGWVLGSISCSTGRCPVLAHTTNAGHSWSLMAGPATTINPYPGMPDGMPGVSAVRFADSHNGWIFGPELWATHDGGHTWTRVSIFGGHAGIVLDLEATHGTATAVLYDGLTHFRIATSPVAANSWAVVHQALGIGAGPVPELQLVLAGTSGWVLQNDRTVVNGARLVGGTWVGWFPACAGVIGPAQLAAVNSVDIFAVCDNGLWSTPSGEHLYRSTNGGVSFSHVGTTVPTYPADEAAAASLSTVVVAGNRGSSNVLEATFNGGSTWTQVLTLPDGALADLGFTTTTQGVLIVAGHLDMTRDGGHTWIRITF